MVIIKVHAFAQRRGSPRTVKNGALLSATHLDPLREKLARILTRLQKPEREGLDLSISFTWRVNPSRASASEPDACARSFSRRGTRRVSWRFVIIRSRTRYRSDASNLTSMDLFTRPQGFD